MAVQDDHNLSGMPGAVRMGMNGTVFFEEHLGLPEERVLFLKDNRVYPRRLEPRADGFRNHMGDDVRGKVGEMLVDEPFTSAERVPARLGALLASWIDGSYFVHGELLMMGP